MGVYSQFLPVETTRYTVPGWGRGQLWMRGETLLAHDFRFGGVDAPGVDDVGADAERVDGVCARAPRAPRSMSCDTESQDARAGRLVRRFRDLLAGGADDLRDVEIDLEWATPFQRAVATTLRAVPRGEVVSYGELAALAGYAGAARAAGTFCATNRFAFVVPCHRVVSATGIGGYGTAGVSVKRRLLALEGVRL